MRKPASVDSYAGGASPYGLLNMAGNVAEWVNDWYNGTYYDRSPDQNPPGPESGVERVLRGGGWRVGPGGRWFRPVASFIRATVRSSVYLDYRNDYVGFRCAVSQGD